MGVLILIKVKMIFIVSDYFQLNNTNKAVRVPSCTLCLPCLVLTVNDPPFGWIIC